jgi:hypothetical protein
MNNLFLLPASLLANTISPLAFVFLSRLLFGNFLIGIIEGLIVYKILHATKKRAIWIMILANYASMFAGLILIQAAGLKMADELLRTSATLNNIFYFILFMPAFAYIMTVFMEWPFCHWINPHKPKSKKRSLAACLIAQTVSYIVILPFYFSGMNLYRQTSMDPTLSFAKNPTAWIYYISTEDNFLYRCRTNSTSVEKVYDKRQLDRYGLFFWPDKTNGTFELRYGLHSIDPFLENTGIEIIDNLSWDGSLPVWYNSSLEPWREKSLWQRVIDPNFIKEWWYIDPKYDHSVEDYNQNGGDFADYRTQANKEWHVSAPPFAFTGYGLQAGNTKGDVIDISLKTPYMEMGCSNVTVLPANQVVCQLGWQMVILFDLDSRKIGMVARGHSPVVVFEKEP